jgi:O-antigen ligase
MFEGEYNKFDIFLLVIVSSLLLGDIGGAIQLPRILVFLFLPMWVYTLSRRYSKVVVATIIATFLFVSIAIISLKQSYDLSISVKNLIYLGINCILFIQVVSFSSFARNPVKFISIGWVIFVIFTVTIGMIEIIYDYHLPISRFDSGAVINVHGMIQRYYFASATFSNSNTYSMILCYALVFFTSYLFFDYRINKSVYGYILKIFLILAIILQIVNFSRGVVISLLFLAMILFSYRSELFKFRLLKVKKILSLVVFLMFTSAFIYNYSEVILTRMQYRLNVESLTQDESRFAVYTVLFTSLVESNYLGVGLGNSARLLVQNNVSIDSPHNLILELIVELGILSLLFYIIFLIFIIKSAILCRAKSQYILIAFLITSIPLSIVNSSYLLYPAQWVFWASVLVVAVNKNNSIIERY